MAVGQSSESASKRPFDFVELDASDWSEERLRALAEAHKHFDLGKGPVLRVTLLQLSAHERVLLLVVHHIVADFWSLATMMRELAAFYDAARDEQSPSLPALCSNTPIMFVCNPGRSKVNKASDSAAFWGEEFESEPPKLDLPLQIAHGRPSRLLSAGLTQSGSTRV